ncbi:MAG: tetratricopeptide repeat protein, partial [Tepidisphaeraceae bacterium]
MSEQTQTISSQHSNRLADSLPLPELLAQARQLHLAGQLEEAASGYRRVLESEPQNVDALHGLGILELQRGRLEEARQCLAEAVAVNSDEWRYHCTLGQILTAMDRLEEGAAAYQRAADLHPDAVEAQFGLGLALQANGKRKPAIAAYRRALAIKPVYVEAHNNLGNALQAEGHLGEAIASYRQALAIRPDFVEAQSNLGGALQASGKLDEAIASFRAALEQRRDFAPLYNNLGTALSAARQLDEAEAILRKALELKPDFAQAWYNLGNALRAKNEFAKAVEAYLRAVALKPDMVEAHINLGHVLHATGSFKEAAAAYLAAMTVRPDCADAYTNAGATLQKMGKVDEAISLLRRAIQLKPDFHIAYCNLGNLLKDSGNLDEALACYRRAIELRRGDAITHSNLAYAVHFHPDYDGPAILRENLRWNVIHAHPLAKEIRPHENDRSPQRRLRVGYVSPDFRDHCQALFTIPLLSRHDHAQLEVFCYANIARPDAVTERIKGYADVWRPTTGLNDQQVAEVVRADEIDILVDLTMHMSYGRPLLFARKPAPVQVVWLAYPGTTGMSAMDYRLTDPHLDPLEDPPGDRDCWYSEESVRLPDSFWCYDPLTSEPAVNELPALLNGRVTFGCLNNFCKVSDRTLALWGRVMAAVGNSRMVMLCPPGGHRSRVLDKMGEGGIASERIEFVEFQSRKRYLEVYHRIDLGLDTFPYNGHTTSLDSYWMGVPVVSAIGVTAVGRAGWSQLSNLNLRELAGETGEDFVRIAVELAKDLPRLGELRRTMRERIERSPLMDAGRFARGME